MKDEAVVHEYSEFLRFISRNKLDEECSCLTALMMNIPCQKRAQFRYYFSVTNCIDVNNSQNIVFLALLLS